MHEEFIHELISAFVDGEVTEDERLRAEQLLASRDDLRQYRDELLMMRSAVHQLPRFQLPETFSRSILQQLESDGSPPVALPAPSPSDFPNFSGTSGGGWTARAMVLLFLGSVAALLVFTLYLAFPGADRGPGDPPMQVAEETDSHTASTDGLLAEHDGRRRGDAARHDTSESRREASQPTTEDLVERPPEPARRIPADREFPHPPPRVDLPDLAGIHESQFTIMLAIDAVLSSRGIDEQVFTRVLERAEIPWMDEIPVDPRLEQNLLASRVFGGVRADQLPRDRTPGSQSEPVHFLRIHFVVGRGEQINEVIEQLLTHKETGEVVAVQIELAMGGAESDLAAQLQRGFQPGAGIPADSVRAQPLAIDRAAQQRLWAALNRVAPRIDPSGDRESRLEIPETPADQAVHVPLDWEKNQALMTEMKFPVLMVFRSEDDVRGEEARP